MTWKEFKKIDPENMEICMHTFFALAIRKYCVSKDGKIHIYVKIRDWLDLGKKENDYVVDEKYFVSDKMSEYSELLTEVREYLVDYTIKRSPAFKNLGSMLYDIYLLSDWVKYNPEDNSISEVNNG